MKPEDELRKVFEQSEEEQPVKMAAWIGKLDGTVAISENSPYVYATTISGVVMTVFNDRVPNRLWYPVWIGNIDNDPYNVRVLEPRQVYGAPMAALPPNLAQALGLGGDDPLPIRSEMIVPWLVRWNGTGLNIEVFGMAFETATGWKAPSTYSFDLTSHLPGTGARWVLVSVNTSGTITLTDGSPVTNPNALILSNIPATPAGNMALSAIKIQAGQTELYFSKTRTSFLDLRYGGKGSGGGGSSFTGTPGSVVVTDGAGALATNPGFTFDPTLNFASIGDNPPPPVNMSASFHQVADQQNATHYLWSWGNVFVSKFVGWRARGTKASPVAVLTDDELSRLSGGGYDGTVLPENTATSGNVRITADENFTATAHGTRAEIWTTPIGSLVRRLTAIFKSNGSMDLPVAGSTYNVNGSPHTHALQSNQRVLSASLSLQTGECLILSKYIDLASTYTIDLQGDSTLEIL